MLFELLYIIIVVCVLGAVGMNRQDMILERVSPRIAVHSTLITTFGLKKNEYSNAFNNVITLDDLFS